MRRIIKFFLQALSKFNRKFKVHPLDKYGKKDLIF
jgi:hypothetical protein